MGEEKIKNHWISLSCFSDLNIEEQSTVAYYVGNVKS